MEKHPITQLNERLLVGGRIAKDEALLLANQLREGTLPPVRRTFEGTRIITKLWRESYTEAEGLLLLSRALPDEPWVRERAAAWQHRLADKCYAHFCEKGECLGASISTLRFACVLAPQLVEPLLAPLLQCLFAKDHPGMPVFYLLSALPLCPRERVASAVAREREWLKPLLTRGWRTGPAELDTYNPVRLLLVRDALALLPELAALSSCPVRLCSDGRCVVTAEQPT